MFVILARFVLFETHLRWHFPFVSNFTKEIFFRLMNGRAAAFWCGNLFVCSFHWRVLFGFVFTSIWSNGTAAAAIDWQLIDGSVFSSSSFDDAGYDYLKGLSLIETSTEFIYFSNIFERKLKKISFDQIDFDFLANKLLDSLKSNNSILLDLKRPTCARISTKWTQFDTDITCCKCWAIWICCFVSTIFLSTLNFSPRLIVIVVKRMDYK